MILYLDTSALVKLYMEEEGSEGVETLASQAHVLATSWLTYPEARSAFARKHRDKGLTPDEYQLVLSAFVRDWANYSRLEVSYQILANAANLAERRWLKALDAIHLASAIYTAGSPSASTLIFSSADGRLLEVAKAEGLATQLG